MTTNTKSAQKPTHGVYHVRGEGKSAYWTQIGAAWLHDDKQGLNLALDFLPVRSEGRLVIRVKTDKPETSEGKAD
jgi:hypothetical protein